MWAGSSGSMAVSHTMYLTSNIYNTAGDSLSHRLGGGMELSLSAELAKSVNGYTGIMELQPGKFHLLGKPAHCAGITGWMRQA